jgi:hypothetical protein
VAVHTTKYVRLLLATGSVIISAWALASDPERRYNVCMEYPDGFIFPEGHPPSPYDYPVPVMKGGEPGTALLPEDLRLCAIGWIERKGFATGSVPDGCLEALVTGHPDKIVSDGTRGIHTCTLCGQMLPRLQWHDRVLQLTGHGHYLVQVEGIVYMAPELLLHYICDHSYCPPQEFVHATVRGEFLSAEDLEIRSGTEAV